MKDETVKSSINTVLMYLAGNIHASALCFMAFILAYKLHIYLDFLSLVLTDCRLP